MIIWSGMGFLVPLLTVICLVVTQGLTNMAWGEKYYENNEWPKMAGFCFSAFMVGLAGYLLNWVLAKRRVINSSTSEEEIIARSSPHTFFFIPMEYWSLALLVMGVAMVSGK
jgi:uncharacterized membrane protein